MNCLGRLWRNAPLCMPCHLNVMFLLYPRVFFYVVGESHIFLKTVRFNFGREGCFEKSVYKKLFYEIGLEIDCI
jgi:hypothetical protein